MSQLDRALRRAREGHVDGDAQLPALRESMGNAVFRSPWNFEIPGNRQPPRLPLGPTLGPTAVAPVEQQFHGFPAELSAKLVHGEQSSGYLREQYRKVAAWVYQLREARSEAKILMVVSAVPGEGKTLTATNLALTLAQAAHSRVLLADVDLRRPRIHEMFDLRNGRGLTDVLTDPTSGELPAVLVPPRLHVLTSGNAAVDPMGALTSDRMRSVLRAAAGDFDWIVLDTPPVDLIPDAKVLAGLADAAILVVHAASTKCEAAQRAVAAVGRDRMLGVVLNQLDDRYPLANRYTGYYGYYEERRTESQ